jgi:hypothetical protein
VASRSIADFSEFIALPPSRLFAVLRVPEAPAARKVATGDVADGRAGHRDRQRLARCPAAAPAALLPEAFIAPINPVRPSASKVSHKTPFVLSLSKDSACSSDAAQRYPGIGAQIGAPASIHALANVRITSRIERVALSAT